MFANSVAPSQTGDSRDRSPSGDANAGSMRRARGASFGTAETFAPAHPVETECAGALMTHGRREGGSRKAIAPRSSIERDYALNTDIAYGPIPQHSAAGIVARVSGPSVSDGVTGTGETASGVTGSRATAGAVHGTLHSVFIPAKPMRTE